MRLGRNRKAAGKWRVIHTSKASNCHVLVQSSSRIMSYLVDRRAAGGCATLSNGMTRVQAIQLEVKWTQSAFTGWLVDMGPYQTGETYMDKKNKLTWKSVLLLPPTSKQRYGKKCMVTVWVCVRPCALVWKCALTRTRMGVLMSCGQHCEWPHSLSDQALDTWEFNAIQ